MTYNVLSGTLSFYTTTTTLDHFFLCITYFNCDVVIVGFMS